MAKVAKGDVVRTPLGRIAHVLRTNRLDGKVEMVYVDDMGRPIMAGGDSVKGSRPDLVVLAPSLLTKI